MNKINILGCLALLIFSSSCVKEQYSNEEILKKDNEFRFVAKMEQKVETRTTLEQIGETNKYNFNWAEGDEISIQYTRKNSSGSILQSLESFKLEQGAGTTEGTFILKASSLSASYTEYTIRDYAMYPHNASHLNGYFSSGVETGVKKANFKSTYGATSTAYSPNTNAVMYAELPEGGFEGKTPSLQFKHLGGVLCLNLKDLPVGTQAIKLTANKTITGNIEWVQDEDGNNMVKSPNTTNNNSITINFKKFTEARNEVFYFPLPVGTYQFKVEYKGGDNAMNTIIDSKRDNEIKRAGITFMPELLVAASGNTQSALESALETHPEFVLTSDMEITGPIEINKTFTINLAGHKLTFNNGTDDRLAAFNVLKGGVLSINASTAGSTVEAVKDGDLIVFLADGGKATIAGVNNSNTATGTFKGGLDMAPEADVTTTTMVVNGGTYYGFNPAADERFQVEGMSLETNKGVYELKKGTVKLTANTTVLSPIYMNSGTQTLNLNNFTLTMDNEASDIAIINVGGKAVMTLQGCGSNKPDGKLQVKAGSNHSCVIAGGSSEFKITSGYPTAVIGTDVTDGATVLRSLGGKFTLSSAKLTVKSPRTDDAKYKLMDVSDEIAETKITISKGGLFIGQDPGLGDDSEAEVPVKVKIQLDGVGSLHTPEGYQFVTKRLSGGKYYWNIPSDVTILSPIVIDDGATHEFQLTYYTINLENDNEDNDKLVAAIDVKSGILNVNLVTGSNGERGGIKVKADKNLSAIVAREGATVNLTNGMYVGHTDRAEGFATLYSDGGIININGSVVKGAEGKLLDVKDDAGKNCIIVSAGDFYGQNPANGDDSEVSKEKKTLIVLGEDCESEDLTTYWKVSKPMVKIGFKPNAEWTADGAWFAVWAWSDGADGDWYVLADEDETKATDGVYEVSIPKLRPNVYFVSFPASVDKSSPDRASIIYQTSNLTVGEQKYYVLGTSGTSGTWMSESDVIK